MKRRFAFVLLSIIALSSVMPLWGIKNARAQIEEEATFTSKGIPKLKGVFYGEGGEKEWWLSDAYTLNEKQATLGTPKATETTASFPIQLVIRNVYDGAIDNPNGAGVGILSPDDSFGGWGSILIRDDTLYDFKGDNDTGIYLEIREGDENTLINQGGPFYNISKLIQKANNAFPQLGIKELKRESFSPAKGEFNIAPFFLFLNDGSIFGKTQTQWSTKVVLNELKPDTQYYVRLVLRGVDTSEIARTKFVTFKTSPQGTGNDPKPEELQEGLGEATGAEGGDVTATIFGDQIECTLYPSTWFGCFAIGYYNTIYYITGWAVRGAAGLMDIFMAYSLGSFIYKNSFIDTGWTVVRDVCNIFFIFILLWTAFKMVINNNHFKAQEVIVNIIVIGLLINFSLFFSKVIIDMGNISARVFYNQIRITGSAQDEVVSKINTVGDVQPKAISEALANGLDLTAISDDGFKMLAKETGYLPLGTVWLLLFLGTIVNVAAAWIFIKVSFAFLGRILSLWMAMIFSPFAFTSTIIGGGHGAGGGPLDMKKIGWTDWLRNILEASFYPALYLFFVFLIILLINDKFVMNLVGKTDELAATPFLIVTLFKIAFVIGLLKVSGDFAKKMAGTFGGELTAVAGKAAAFVGGAAIGIATGGAALAGSRILGSRAAATLGGKEGDRLRSVATMDLKQFEGTPEFEKKKREQDKAKAKLLSLDKKANSSYDLRNTRIAQGLSSATGLNFNAGVGSIGLGTNTTAGGFQAMKDRKAVKENEREEKFKKLLGDKQVNVNGVMLTPDEAKKTAEAMKEDIGDQENLLKNDTGIKDIEKELERIEKAIRDNKAMGLPASANTALVTQRKAEEANLADRKKVLKDNFNAEMKKKWGKEGVSDINSIQKVSDEIAKDSRKAKDGYTKDYMRNEIYQRQSHGDTLKFWSRENLAQIGKAMGAGALTGAAFVGPAGAFVGTVAGALSGGKLSVIQALLRTTNRGIYNLVDKNLNTDLSGGASDHAASHDVAAGHVHAPHAKSSYKTPGGAWLGKIFDGKGFGGLDTGGGGGGHDDHGGGHGGGHDDHGHGGGGHH